MYLKVFGTLLFLLKFYFTSLCQKRNVELFAEMTSPVVNSQKDLTVKLIMTNYTGQSLMVHKYPSFGYCSFCMDDYCLEVQRRENNQYQNQTETSRIDRFGAYDSTGKSWSDIYDTLADGSTVVQDFSLSYYYPYRRGFYRVRFSFQLPAINNLPVKQVASKWIYFEVKAKQVEYSNE